MFLYKLINYNNIKETMFGSSLPPVVCGRAYVLFTLFVFVCIWCCVVLCFCFVFFSSCVPCVASFYGLSIYDRPLIGNVSHIVDRVLWFVVLLESYRIQKFYADEILKSDQHRIKWLWKLKVSPFLIGPSVFSNIYYTFTHFSDITGFRTFLEM